MIRHRTGFAALLAGCAVAAGGAYAATGALSSSAPAAAVSPAQPAGTQSGGAALSSVISEAAGSPDPAAQRRDTPGPLRRRFFARLRRLGGEHGEFTFHTRKGTRTLAFERGRIESVSGSGLTVRAADGTTWNWLLTSTSVVREDGSRASSSALAAGERVFAGGPVTGMTRDARLVVIRKSTSAKPAAPGTSSAS